MNAHQTITLVAGIALLAVARGSKDGYVEWRERRSLRPVGERNAGFLTDRKLDAFEFVSKWSFRAVMTLFFGFCAFVFIWVATGHHL